MKAKFFEKEGQSKKVLLVGLGILGGGTSMAKFILDQGGELTITDLRSKDILKSEINQVDKYAKKLKKQVNYVLEIHNEELFKNSDIVLFNPAVPYFSKWPQYCLENKITFYNDFTLFQEYLNFRKNTAKQIWITGTRGKTTTTAFIHHLLGSDAVIGGNVLGQGLQKISDKKCKCFVIETSNFQLEYPILNNNIVQPEIAVLTNIFIDHINRHKTFSEYKRIKNLIYSYNPNAILFLNKNEKTTQEIWKNKLHKNIKFIKNFENKNFSENQNLSLSFAIEIAKHFGVKDKDIKSRIKTIGLPKMRQEIILENKKYKIINDSTATNPDALISSIKNFPEANFIIGGTDAELDFDNLIKVIKKAKLKENNKIFLLKGTASDKIATILNLEDRIYDNFEIILKQIIKNSHSKKTTIILSPGAKSFGLFKNEYDRGEKFNKIVKKLF